MKENRIDIKFIITEQKYSQGIRNFYFKTRKIKTIFDLVLGFLFLLAGIALKINHPQALLWAYFSITSAIIFFFLIFINYILPVKNYRNNKSLRDEIEMSIDKSKIRVKSESISTKFNWDFFIKYMETENLYILIYGVDIFTMIPKNAFLNKEDKQEFEKLLNKKLDKI